ncbi:hypothetical protein Tco_0286037 [Tanacetum coccineum]
MKEDQYAVSRRCQYAVLKILEEEKARKHGRVFNWETAKYGKICTLNGEIDFKVSFDDSDDEDYTVIFDKNSFSYKKISTNDLKTDSKNDNEKVMPSLPSHEPTVSCFDDLDFFKDFENEFPAIVYSDAQTSKSDLLTEPILSPQHIDEFDLNDETLVSEYDEEEQNILYFNDLFPFNIIHPNDLKSEKDNDDNEIDIILSLEGNEITHGSNVLSETSHDKINKTFKTGSFVMNLNIMIWTYYANGMLFYLIMNLYVPFGIPLDPKRYYKDGDCALMLQRPRSIRHMAPLPPRDQRYLWLRYQVNRVHILDFEGLTPDMRQDLAERMRMVYTGDDGQEFFSSCRIGDEMGLDVARTLCFQMGGARRSMTCKEFILTLGLHTAEEMAKDGFGAYCMDRGAANVLYLLAQFLFSHAEGRKSGARLSRGYFIGRLAYHFGLVSDDGLRGLSVVARKLPLIDMGKLVVPTPVQAPQQPPPPPPVDARAMPQRLGRLEEEVQGLRRDVGSLRGLAFGETFRGSSPAAYQRRVRRMTDDASTFAAQQDQQQPDP